MEPLQRLIEQDRLIRLKSSYFRLYDTRDWKAWLDLFIEDAVLRSDYEISLPGDPPVPTLDLIGRQAIADYIIPLGPTRRTVHHGHTPEIDIHSDYEASGIWAMEDIVEYADRGLHGHGHYHETYRKVDGVWKFASIHLKRLRLVTTVPTGGGQTTGSGRLGL